MVEEMVGYLSRTHLNSAFLSKDLISVARIMAYADGVYYLATILDVLIWCLK
jgi:hypothetical protein